MRGFVIGADAVFAHPVQNGCADTVGAVRLDAAVCDRNNRVRFPAKKPATGFPFCSCTGNCTLFR